MREGWQYKKLGEVGQIITGSTPSTKDSENYATSDYCFFKPSDLPTNSIGHLSSSEYHISKKAFSSSRKLPKGSVLVSCIGSIGKVGILELDAVSNQQINSIIPYSSIDSTFLALAILSIKDEMTAKANAPVVPIINKTDFSNFKIPVPPLSEQQRIVNELDLLSSIIEKKKEQLKELDNLAQSIFYDMFGDPIENPKGWEIKYLEEIADSKIGLTYKPTDVEEHGTIVLRSSNIQDSTIDLSDIVRVSCNISKTKYVKEGDVLMCSRNGSFRLVGKVARIKGLPEEMTYGAFMTIIRSCYNDYLFHFFKSPAFRVQLGTAKTATINQITVKMLNSIKVGIPPLELQQQFASKIEAIEHQKELIRQSIKEVETLFNSRMDYYFG